ncbi:hypothetical protein [Rhizobium sp. Root1204]|uniref:hypothetical protein n=1 Tax=Rhizobium sp. Root1204 TaxID=1736428 RepID=UPI000713032B|nr:hypothetical protein [Rhizobium sp. Root1204]KQV41236.1 hypothetical protein ASC96_18210 [Rhizobium sp. Root1204]
MSDGPHKSLPLRPRYRKLAEWASKPAFAITQLCEAAEAALLRDATIELAPAMRQFMSIVDGNDLFSRLPDLVQGQLSQLRDDPAIQPLAASAIECAQMAVHAGLNGRDAVREAVATALTERLSANSRSSEEHYLVKEGRGASLDIRVRLAQTVDAMDANGSFSRMALSIIGDTSATVLRAPSVHDGLDEGVPLQ